jgi:hypothetical protein
MDALLSWDQQGSGWVAAVQPRDTVGEVSQDVLGDVAGHGLGEGPRLAEVDEDDDGFHE